MVKVNLQFTSTSINMINASWDKPEQNVTGYIVTCLQKDESSKEEKKGKKTTLLKHSIC